MDVTRRKFMQAAAAGAAGLGLSESATGAQPKGEGRHRRMLYYNDARHYYLYVFEPPMKLARSSGRIDHQIKFYRGFVIRVFSVCNLKTASDFLSIFVFDFDICDECLIVDFNVFDLFYVPPEYCFYGGSPAH